MPDPTPIEDEVVMRLIAEAEHQEKHADNPGFEQFYHCVANAMRYLLQENQRQRDALAQAEEYRLLLEPQ